MAKKFEAGLEIKADVKGTESVSRLADEIDAAGIDTSKLRQEGAELAQQWQQLENNQKLIARFRELKLEARDESFNNTTLIFSSCSRFRVLFCAALINAL